MKNLKGRNVRVNKQVNRSVGLAFDLTKGLHKEIYRKELGKLTDRFVPTLKTY
jgi:hypothetical protein